MSRFRLLFHVTETLVAAPVNDELTFFRNVLNEEFLYSRSLRKFT
jgi:hypothetical protein